ncbi:MAG: RAD52 family DNA repair protein [Acidobacteriota bacterium]|nr:RAD52 family DNA repair protein [Acidobacteriota bacterium]
MAAENQAIETEPQAEETVKTSNKIELRSIRDIIKDLRKPISPRHLRTRKQGGKELTYISWHDAIKYLDHYAPGWCYEVRNIASIGGRLVITVRISILCAEGTVWREATGQEEEDTSSFGDPSSNAESMALRRAASKFGLGLYLYEKG